jgi:hypothetical protein
MKLSLAALGLTVLGVLLLWSDAPNPLYAIGWVALAVGLLAGVAGAVNALVSSSMAPWKRVVAFLIGAAPPGFAVFAFYVVSHMPYD